MTKQKKKSAKPKNVNIKTRRTHSEKWDMVNSSFQNIQWVEFEVKKIYTIRCIHNILKWTAYNCDAPENARYKIEIILK